MTEVLSLCDYFMKCLVFALIFGFISLGAIGGCSNNNGGEQNGTKTLTENDFGMDPSLVADPEKNLIVKFLEHQDSERHKNDTGEVGNDVFPITYKRTLEHTFCWEDNDSEAMHFMELENADGTLIFRLNANGDCITEIIEAGDYVMTIHHDGRILTTHPVFIIPNPDDIEQTRNTEGLFNRLKVAVAHIVKDMQNTVNIEAEAQTVQDNINTLIKTNNCQNCDLQGADLSNANLSGAVLNNANLSRAKLNNANLTNANLNGVILSSTNFSGATWCDGGCTCGDNSFDMCIGCASIDRE